MKRITNRHKKAYCWYVIILLFLLCSCKEGRRRLNIQQVVAEWTGKEIQFPTGIPCRSMGIDTDCINITNLNYKILLYVDSLGCSSCRLKLSEWKQIIAEADSLFSGEVDFLFFFQPKKQDESFWNPYSGKTVFDILYLLTRKTKLTESINSLIKSNINVSCSIWTIKY